MLRFIFKFMCPTHTQAFLVPQSLQIQGGLLDDTQSDSVPMFNLNCLDLNILAAHLARLQTESLLMGWHWFQHVIIDTIVIYPTAHSRCNDSWFLTLPRAQNRLPKLIKRELAEVRLVTHGQTASAISIVSRDPANCFSSDSKAFFFIFSFFLFLVFFPSVILAFLLVRQCFPKFKLMTAINSIAQDQQFPA